MPMTKQQFIEIAKDFLYDIDGYISMVHEPYGNGRMYPEVDTAALLTDFERYINEHAR